MCALVTGFQTCALPILAQLHVGEPFRAAAEGVTEGAVGGDAAAVVDDGLQCGGGIAAAVGFAVAVVGDVVRIAIARGVAGRFAGVEPARSEEHTSELQSLMSISYCVFCLKKKINKINRPSSNI